MVSADEKRCPYCGETIKASAIKCRFCGEFLAPSPAGTLSGSTPVGGGAGTYTSDAPDSVMLYEGRLSRIVLFWPTVLLILGIAIAVLVGVLFGPNSSLIVVLSISAGIVLVALVYYLIRWIKYRSEIYRITNDRIEFEHGVFSRTVENTDMWRIRDIEFKAPFVHRLFGAGWLDIDTSDQSRPHIDIGPLPRAKPLYHVLKSMQMRADQRQGVVHIEQ